MKNNAVFRQIRVFVASACMAATTLAFADCQTTRPPTAADVSAGHTDSLLKAMVTACQGQDPDKFFTLQTTDANNVIAKGQAANKKELFSQYCAFTSKAVGGLGGNVSAAVHSVVADKKTTKCGSPTSNWLVHNKAGELVLRLEVAVESGRLKIDTQ
jgi:hypothetical protein